jgi:hypothetical protein
VVVGQIVGMALLLALLEDLGVLNVIINVF